MNTTATRENGFIGYEYKDVTVSSSLEALYTDSYGNFGWQLDGTDAPLSVGLNAVTLKFKRDRKIPGKAELSRLERQFNTCANEVLKLEREKGIAASVAAYVIGVVGAGFTVGGIFACVFRLM